MRDAVELIAAMSLAREARNQARLRLLRAKDEVRAAETALIYAEALLTKRSDAMNGRAP